MAGLDPTQGGALGAAVNAADLQFLETALTLDASAAALQTKISVGDILAARILPPQGGHDFIEVAGQTLAAQLPPQVYPGDVLALQVTGITSNQIFVRNLGAADPESLPAQPQTQAVPQNAPHVQTPAQTQAQSTPAQAPLQAPPRAVFVAASVVRSQPQAQPAAQNAAPVKSAPAPIDARIAAQQTSARTPVPAAPPPPASAALRAPFVAPVVANRAPVARTVSDVLRSIKLPDTAFTRTVAAIAQQAPQRLSPVLRRLETVLAQLPSDPRAATIRAIAGFIGKLNLSNTETLTAQIEAYVSHAVRGGEAKLTSLLQALNDAAVSEAATESHTQSAQPRVTAQPAAPAAPNTHAQGTQAAKTAPVQVSNAAAHARAAVLSEANAHDLKTAMLSLLRDAPGGRTGSVAQALNESLVTIAGNQLNTLNTSAQAPGTIAFALPAFFHDGGKPAYVRISRDGEGSRAPMDADNFHIAFVLDTANLGTVAIDVQTSGRAVNVDVKTEAAPAASAFREGFSALRDRLEHLRYRVSSTAANVLQPKSAPAHTAPPLRTAPAQRESGLDAQA